jgi:hypothetical protein
LLNVLNQHAEGLPLAEQEAKWSALAKVVARIETRAHAKHQERPKTAQIPRPTRKHG